MEKNTEKKEKLLVDRRAGGGFRKYLHVGITAFLVLSAAIVLIFLFVQKEDFSATISKIMSALAPVIIGAILAYILNPLMSFFEKKIAHFLVKRVKKKVRALKFARGCAMIITFIVVLCILAVLAYMLIPEIVDTVERLADEVPGQADNFMNWFTNTVGDGSAFGNTLQTIVSKVTMWVEDFVENGLLTFATSVVESLATGVFSVFGIIYNIVIGCVFCVYILLSKESFTAGSKKLVFAIFKRKKANKIIRVARACHAKFTGAITGKILDSAIVGVLCFVGMTLFKFPYAALISVIVGVTNVIPFFGPYIGAIPSALLILFVDPFMCLWFVVFIIVLQQIDCNILDPKIVGESIGLSAFWVLFACVVFGSLFGIMGLLLGVPAMACIYMIIGDLTDGRLHKRGLPTNTDDYLSIDAVDETEMYCVEVNRSDDEQSSSDNETEETGSVGRASEEPESQKQQDCDDEVGTEADGEKPRRFKRKSKVRKSNE